MKSFLLGMVLLFLADVAVQAAEADPTSGAAEWLALVDAARYDDSWSQAGALFQARIQQPDWAARVKPIRDQLGAMKSRQVSTVDRSKTLPGAPDGDYAVVRFHSAFANKAEATETVTLVLQGEQWRMIGYFIK